MKGLGIRHIYSIRNHTQTDVKVERLNRTAKEKLLLIVQASLEVFDGALEVLLHWYRYEDYHEGLSNLHPADVYYGRADSFLEQRKRLKEQTKKARKQANLKPTQDSLKHRHLRTRTLK